MVLIFYLQVQTGFSIFLWVQTGTMYLSYLLQKYLAGENTTGGNSESSKKPTGNRGWCTCYALMHGWEWLHDKVMFYTNLNITA